jgi:hypothetical protein
VRTFYVHPIRQLCRRLLWRLLHEKRAVQPSQPLKPGQTGAEVALNRSELSRLVRTAALNFVAPDEDKRRSDRVIWRDHDSELLVYLSRVIARTQPGAVLIDVPVHCDQVGDAMVHMAFAVGNERRPAGMIAATESKPRGPAAVVDVWGDALLAFGWQLLLKTTEAVAAELGHDAEGTPLVAVGLTASASGVSVLPMARHTFTRKLDPKARPGSPIIERRPHTQRSRP